MSALLTLTTATNATWSHGPVALVENAAPIALPAAATIRMQLRATATEQNVALELSRADGTIVVIDANAATIAIEVPAARMANVPAGSYVFDIIVTQPSGRQHRPVAGTVTVAQGVTR
jgi:hypothetical protein